MTHQEVLDWLKNNGWKPTVLREGEGVGLKFVVAFQPPHLSYSALVYKLSDQGVPHWACVSKERDSWTVRHKTDEIKLNADARGLGPFQETNGVAVGPLYVPPAGGICETADDQ